MKKLVLLAVLSFLFIGTVHNFPPAPYHDVYYQNVDVTPGY